MNWLTLTLASIFFRALFGVSTKVISNKVKASAMTITVLITAAGGIVGLVVSPLIGGLQFGPLLDVWLLTLIAILTSSFGNILYFKGLEKVDGSSAQVIFSSLLIWGAIFSTAFLGSRFSVLQLIGIAILICAIVYVQYQKGVKLINKYSLLLLGSAVLFAMYQVASAEMSKTVTPGTYSTVTYLGNAVVVWLLYFKQVNSDVEKLKKKSNAAFWSFLVGILSVTFVTLAYYAYAAAPDPGVVVLLLTTQVILGVILAIIFLRERNNIPRKITAAVLAVVAGLLIKS